MARSMLLALVVCFAWQPCLAQAQPPGDLRSRTWDLGHLGQAGLEKCRAFKELRRRTDVAQAADHGRLTPLSRRRLQEELNRAKAMAPRSLTPAACGVPL